ncbi:MAG: hypothetical protein PHQ27_09820 [Victivallales bacterium]|nr:hypothetical protein [Victivallales bacterium]
MKRIVGTLLLAAGLGLTAIAADTASDAPVHFDFQLPETIEMPGGEIYHHPKVVEVRPDGVSIMHDNGVAFWPYSQLPEAVRKKFHYNPVAAQKYTDELLLRRQQLDVLKREKEIFNADEQVYINLESARYQCTALRMKIDAVKRQIQWDKQKTSQINTDVEQDRSTIGDDLKDSDSSSRSDSISNMFGYWNNNSSDDNAVRTHILGDYKQDWRQGKINYDMWTFAEHGQENNLAEYIQQYHQEQAKVKQLEKEWAEIKKTSKLDQAKLYKKINAQVNATIKDSLQKLQELRKMRDDQLITQKEYIDKKAQILKRF